MHHVMFDIDGTLVQSTDMDSECFVKAVEEVLGITIDSDWLKYDYVTDSGILGQVIRSIGRENDKNAIECGVKGVFLHLLASDIESNQINEVKGAASFLSRLRGLDGITLSIATGGWYESALLKLNSAGIDVSDIPLSSSSDHFDRVEIIKMAKSKSLGNVQDHVTYFGDGEWDRQACFELGYNFVLIGNKIEHHKKISDFSDFNMALEYIGL